MAQHLCPHCGMTFEDEEMTDLQMAKFIWSERYGHLDEWELEFFPSILERMQEHKKSLTDKQSTVLFEKYKGLINMEAKPRIEYVPKDKLPF